MNVHAWMAMDENRRIWITNYKNGWKWLKIDKNWLKLIKMDENLSKWMKIIVQPGRARYIQVQTLWYPSRMVYCCGVRAVLHSCNVLQSCRAQLSLIRSPYTVCMYSTKDPWSPSTTFHSLHCTLWVVSKLLGKGNFFVNLFRVKIVHLIKILDQKRLK